ncbi:MAG TPA: class I SAM-dependent DNA methyltransferase [Rickettsiales bacterium]|nr:class I SAM-dependent DNA methyltransferase [Rickettsiales bacterium]
MVSQETKKRLWAVADKLRSNMDAAEYKHIVLGLIFLKYVSDTFSEHRNELQRKFTNPNDEYYLSNQGNLARELEDRDYYTEANVFWVPENARWDSIRNNAKQPNLGKLIDEALLAIEAENPRLKNILDKRFARTELEPGKLGELVDEISKIGFEGKEKAKDVLGEVYEYFLGQFANAEGKKGGQFYTPASVVKIIVEIIAPHKGKVYDPCCGSGGMFVQSEKFLESHGGKFGDISIYGQEANPTTWRLVAMNLAIRGMDFNLGKEPADSFTRNQHPDLRADYIMANPPFNISDWWNEKLAEDVRWAYGTPPAGNANYAWLSHILYHLKPSGLAGVVLANGSMSSSQNNEGAIRKEMIEKDVVDCMIALPPQLFFNTQIPACLWFLTKDKKANGRDRRGEILFIDARKLGRMETRVNRVLDEADIAKIATAYHAWRTDGETTAKYENVPGFVYAAKKAEVAANDYVLTPGRYVGAEAIEEDDEAFAEKMTRLTSHLKTLMEEGATLDNEIRRQLEKVGYGF